MGVSISMVPLFDQAQGVDWGSPFFFKIFFLNISPHSTYRLSLGIDLGLKRHFIHLFNIQHPRDPKLLSVLQYTVFKYML